MTKRRHLDDKTYPVTTSGAGYFPPSPVISDDDKLKVSTKIMHYARQSQLGHMPNVSRTEQNTRSGGTPQDTYLLDRNAQRKVFLRNGYIEVPGDYGLVRKAVGNRNIPVYQQNPDAITRDELTPIGNINDVWFGEPQKQLEHPGSFPSTIYRGIDGNFYQKAWDLNDYGGASAGDGGTKYKTMQLFAEALDLVGSPTVVTTGFQPVKSFIVHTTDDDGKFINDYSYKEAVDKMMSRKGLYPVKDTNLYGLPEVTVYGKRKKPYKAFFKPRRSLKSGGAIHIDPANRGKFNATKERTGKTTEELTHSKNPLTRKRAIFAQNAAKWNH